MPLDRCERGYTRHKHLQELGRTLLVLVLKDGMYVPCALALEQAHFAVLELAGALGGLRMLRFDGQEVKPLDFPELRVRSDLSLRGDLDGVLDFVELAVQLEQLFVGVGGAASHAELDLKGAGVTNGACGGLVDVQFLGGGRLVLNKLVELRHDHFLEVHFGGNAGEGDQEEQLRHVNGPLQAQH